MAYCGTGRRNWWDRPSLESNQPASLSARLSLAFCPSSVVCVPQLTGVPPIRSALTSLEPVFQPKMVGGVIPTALMSPDDESN